MVSPISVCQDRTSPRSPGLSLHSGSEGSDVPPHSGSKGPDRTLPSRSLPPSSTQCHLRPNPYKLSPDAGSEGPVEMFPYRTVPRPLNPTWCSLIPWFATMLRHQAVLRQRCPLRPPVQHDAPQSPWITTTSHHQASPATCPPVCDPLPNCSPAPLDHRDAPPPNGSYHMFPSPPDGPHHVFPGPANLYDLIDHIFPDRPHCPPAPLGHRDAPPPNGSYHMFPSPAHGPHNTHCLIPRPPTEECLLPVLTFTSLAKHRSASEKLLPGPGTSPNVPVSWWKQALRPLPMSGLGHYPNPEA